MTWTERLRTLGRRLVDARPMTEDEQREAGAGLLGLLESPSLAQPLRDLSDEDVARLLAAANVELRRRSHGAIGVWAHERAKGVQVVAEKVNGETC